MSDGEVAQVHTPFTTRAKELMELYNGLMLPLLTVAAACCKAASPAAPRRGSPGLLGTARRVLFGGSTHSTGEPRPFRSPHKEISTQGPWCHRQRLRLPKKLERLRLGHPVGWAARPAADTYGCSLGHIHGCSLGHTRSQVDERLDVLLHVKWTVKEFDCNLSRDVVELIDREADMLNRGRGEASLSGLRKRLANLFLQFIETPEFNPEAARFQKVPQELTLRPNVKPIAGH